MSISNNTPLNPYPDSHLKDNTNLKKKSTGSLSPKKPLKKLKTSYNNQEIKEDSTNEFLLSNKLTNQVIKQTKLIGMKQLVNEISMAFPDKQLLETQKTNVNEIFYQTLKWTDERLKQEGTLTTVEINNIYEIIFKPIFNRIYALELQKNDPINPSIPCIFQHLKEAIDNIDNYKNCELALGAVNQILQMRPTESFKALEMNAILNSKLQDQISTDIKIHEKKIKSWKNKLQKSPIILTRDLLYSNNKQDTYVLNNSDGKSLWIFKPDYQNTELNQINEDTAVYEHTASLINENCQFPVPRTIYIQFKNWNGSAQFFIPNAKKMNEIIPQDVSQLELQKIIIFDIIFGNNDRHVNNILFDKDQPYAIDHDLCFLRELKDELRLEYMECLHKNSIFLPEIIALFSGENIKKYIAALQIHEEIKERAIHWMQLAAKRLTELVNENAPISHCIEEIQFLWKSYVREVFYQELNEMREERDSDSEKSI